MLFAPTPRSLPVSPDSEQQKGIETPSIHTANTANEAPSQSPPLQSTDTVTASPTILRRGFVGLNTMPPRPKTEFKNVRKIAPRTPPPTRWISSKPDPCNNKSSSSRSSTSSCSSDTSSSSSSSSSSDSSDSGSDSSCSSSGSSVYTSDVIHPALQCLYPRETTFTPIRHTIPSSSECDLIVRYSQEDSYYGRIKKDEEHSSSSPPRVRTRTSSPLPYMHSTVTSRLRDKSATFSNPSRSFQQPRNAWSYSTKGDF